MMVSWVVVLGPSGVGTCHTLNLIALDTVWLRMRCQQGDEKSAVIYGRRTMGALSVLQL